MGIQTWRRFHGELIATVIAKGNELYAVAVWDEPAGIIREPPRMFDRLDSAKAAADDLLRRTFGHKRAVESCGEWLVWST
jgi:hypothetical protein